MYKIIVTFIIALTLSGCSVFMAASGSKEPDMGRLSVGSDRAEVEEVLGRPIKFSRGWEGDVATYQYFTGDEPSMQRAALYAILDGVTLGLAELVTFQGEALQGDKHTVIVKYDRKGKVRDMQHLFLEQPVPKFKKEIIEKGASS